MNITGKELKITGRFPRIARVAEGYEFIDDPHSLSVALRRGGPRADLLTFVQRLSEPSPRFDYPREQDNFAAISVSTYEHWFGQQINRKTRNMIRKSGRLGVNVREVPFDNDLVAGIAAINNETPIRQGRRFPHYQDDLEIVRRENGSFRERSTFLGAYHDGLLIGYVKLTTDETGQQAGLMQILSLIGHRDKAPANLLIAEAVRYCAKRSIPYLWYAKFTYPNKQRDSLADFKEHNGFHQIDVPRYYVPLTPIGALALRLGLQRGVMRWLPPSISMSARRFRNRWYERPMQVGAPVAGPRRSESPEVDADGHAQHGD